MEMTLQRFLTHCTEKERREEMRVYISVNGYFGRNDIISFDLSDIVFNQDIGIIEECKINGVEAPANIETLNILITEEMTGWNKYKSGDFSVDVDLFCPSAEYLKDLYFFENIEEEF